jgi:hypothetical protein
MSVICRHAQAAKLTLAAPPRPSRTDQLSGHTISNPLDLGDSSPRPARKHTHIRVPRWPLDHHISLQATINKPGSQAQTGRVHLLLSHARDACNYLHQCTGNRVASKPQQSRCWNPQQHSSRSVRSRQYKDNRGETGLAGSIPQQRG